MFSHASAPVRIGLAGGGTDLPAWTAARTGRCLSLAISMHTHAVAITRRDKQVVAAYRQRDTAGAATEIANGLIRESALMHGWVDGFEVHTLSEVSSHGSGLGVSSSIAVALAACFKRLRDLADGKTAEPKWQDGGEPAFRASMARDAWTVEIDRLRRPIGRQDHVAAAYGGLRLYEFEGADARVAETFMAEDAAWVASHLLLLPLPEGHDSRAILSGVKNAEHLRLAYDSVDIALDAIRRRDADLLGRAFITGHGSKLKIPGAVPANVREVLSRVGEIMGVHGAKIAGAGGGGHVVVAFDGKASTREVIEGVTELKALTVEPDMGGVRSEGWV